MLIDPRPLESPEYWLLGETDTVDWIVTRHKWNKIKRKRERIVSGGSCTPGDLLRIIATQLSEGVPEFELHVDASFTTFDAYSEAHRPYRNTCNWPDFFHRGLAWCVQGGDIIDGPEIGTDETELMAIIEDQIEKRSIFTVDIGPDDRTG